MKIIFLREAGGARTVNHGTLLWSMGSLAATLLVTALFLIANHLGSAEPEIVTQWRAKLDLQQEALEDLQLISTSQAQTLGRQIAMLQARILRMEALGERVVEVADLDAEDFSFGEPAATGGPLAHDPGAPLPATAASLAEQVLDIQDMQPEVDGVARSIRVLERELRVMESLLRDKEYRQAIAPTGRPITWGWMSSKYGERLDPISGKKAWHAGVDFAGKKGSDVVAVGGGVVTYAGKRYGYGKMVEIAHGDGYVTRYGHHQEVLVALGDVVKPGEVIGLMGSSGRSTGPHVHLEVLKNGRHVDPSKYVASKR